MTDAQAALAQVREALAARPTPGQWFAVNDGNRTEPFMNVKAERISGRGPTHEVAICATGDSPQSMETANARYIAACSPVNMAAILAHVEAVEMENARIWGSNKELAAELERLRAERDEHAHWRRDLADKLHDRETTISAAWEALRSAGVHSEATIDDGICLLRRQLAEAEQDARRYRWLRGSSCPDHSRRWTLWEIRHWRAPFWTGDLRHGDLDAAIDAQIEQERSDD